ncbi:MAG: hypothetical protein Q8N47_11865 [Bryobacterales bacterium]|nr:hypothetical protein [Bryobacterales bacterium]
MSRGPVGNLSGSSDLLVLQPSLQLLGSYESGLYLPSVDSLGRQVGSGGSFGATASAGVNGYHRWKRTILGLNYQGNFRHYTRNPYLDGIDQIVSLNIQRQTSARTTVGVSGAGGTYSRGYGFGGGEGFGLNYGDFSQGVDPTLAAVPRFDLLDTRTYYAAGGADLIHQKSARLSFRAGGTAFAVRRRAKGLVEMNGYSARGDIMYRVGRRSTLGIDYSFSAYRFVRGFGSSDIHMAALNYSVQLDRNWTLALRGGGYRLENLRAVRVALDPAVAAILGQTGGVEAFYGINYGSIYGAGLSRNFRRAGLTLRFDRGIMPGNGVFLTSRQDAVSAGFGYRGWRRWSLSFEAAYSRMATTFQDFGSYQGYTAGVSTAYRVSRYVHLVAHSGWRTYQLQGNSKGRDSYFASVGLGFTPRDLPLSLR